MKRDFEKRNQTIINSAPQYEDCVSLLLPRLLRLLDKNFLNLNVKKTKKMIVDYSKSPNEFMPANIKGDNVEVVKEYKYLGNVIDHKLKGDLNVSQIHKKCNQRLYFLRKLKNVKVDRTILTLFYTSIIQSVLSFYISSWFGNCSDGDIGKLSKIVNCAERLGCVNVKRLEELYEDAVRAKFDKIWSNDNHPPSSQLFSITSSWYQAECAR